MTTTCKNCGFEFNLNFCPSCGQKATVKRIEFKSLVKDVPLAVWQVDRGLLFNLVQLFRRPGYAIKDYLEGKRKNFFHPLSYLLIILAIMLIAMNLMKVHYYDPVQDAWMSPEQAAYWKEYDATQQTWIHYYKFYIPFYLPWMALIFYLWLRAMKEKYTYWEAVVISCFVSAQMTVPQILVLTLTYLVRSTAFARASDMVLNNSILLTLYFFQFYQLGNPLMAKSRRAALAALGALLLLAFAYAAIYLFLNLATRIGSPF